MLKTSGTVRLAEAAIGEADAVGLDERAARLVVMIICHALLLGRLHGYERQGRARAIDVVLPRGRPLTRSPRRLSLTVWETLHPTPPRGKRGMPAKSDGYALDKVEKVLRGTPKQRCIRLF